MTQKLFKGLEEGVVECLGAVNREEDLKHPGGGKVRIDPPPENGCCDCCGRHMSKLTPFGGPGDPLVGDFSGELLVKKYRRFGPYDKEAVKAWEEYEKLGELDGKREVEFPKMKRDPLLWFIAKFGKDKGEELFWAGMAYGQSGSSWECRDCAVLDLDEYFEKLSQIEEADLGRSNHD